MSGIHGATTCPKSETCRKYAYSTIDPDESQENDAMNDEYSPSLAPDLPPHVPTDEQPEGEASHPPTVVQVKPLQLQNPIMKRSP